MDGGGGMDAPVVETDDTPAVDAQACLGFSEGFTECLADTRMCCSGYWYRFFDGPCRGLPDAGAPDGAADFDAGNPCDVDPYLPGCPCTTAGEVHCEIARWRRVCEGGRWVEETNYACCPF